MSITYHSFKLNGFYTLPHLSSGPCAGIWAHISLLQTRCEPACLSGLHHRSWTAFLFLALPHPQAGLDERGAAAQETVKPEVNLSLCTTAAEKSWHLWSTKYLHGLSDEVFSCSVEGCMEAWSGRVPCLGHPVCARWEMVAVPGSISQSAVSLLPRNMHL